MRSIFLKKYHPTTLLIEATERIVNATQAPEELFHEFVNLFNLYCMEHHTPLLEESLIESFYEGLMSDDRRMLDSASGGDALATTPGEAWEIVAKLAEIT